MSAEGGGASVTLWIGDLKNGGDSAAAHLWDRYCRKLASLAAHQLKVKLPRGGIGDEDDAANSAFKSLCLGLRGGEFSRVDNRDDLWRLLVVITKRKVADIARIELTKKRGGGKTLREGDLAGHGGDSDLGDVDGGGLEGFWIDSDPTPDDAVSTAEQCDHLLEILGDDTLRSIALARMAGKNDSQIAEEFGVSRRWVQRKLFKIREIWSEYAERGVST
jgi:DNA-directed RNA polymerase specialized sigma24 family protein